MTIRQASESDLDACVLMGEDFHNSTPYAFTLAGNPTAFRAIGERLVTDPSGVLFVAEAENAPVGMLGGMLFDHPLSGERTAGELFWWSNPTQRGSTGVRLLKAFEGWARGNGAVSISMIQPTWADRVGELYDALGYQRIEVAWTKKL